MRETCLFDYATIRVVPRVEREEFFNAGVILSCPSQKFLDCRIRLNREKLKIFAADIQPEAVEKYLAAIPQICAGAKEAGLIGRLSQRERFYWLTAQRSTIIQFSPVHTGFSLDAAAMLEHLFERMAR